MKYTSKSNLLEELKKLPYFNKDLIYDLGKNEKTYNLKDSTIDTYISRFLKHKDIISLKRELYVTTDFYDKHRNDTSYLFYLSNILRSPSYVTSWTALQYYNLATEIIHTVTAVTTKITRSYKTKIGAFSYQSIKKDLFSDFSLIKDNNFEFFIATPAKALFDLLYFKTKQFKNIKLNDIDYLIEELRIDITEMDETEKNKFYYMLKKYIKYE